MGCLSKKNMIEYIDREVSEKKRKIIQKHLKGCEKCQHHFNRLKADIELVHKNMEILNPPNKNRIVLEPLQSEKKRFKHFKVLKNKKVYRILKPCASAFLLLLLSLLVLGIIFAKPALAEPGMEITSINSRLGEFHVPDSTRAVFVLTEWVKRKMVIISIIVLLNVFLIFNFLARSGKYKFGIRLMKKIKKFSVRLLIAITILLIVFFIFNQFDARLDPNRYTLKDLRPATFDKNNGYYYIWTLIEPSDVNVESDELLNKCRKCFDPRLDMEWFKTEWKYRAKKKSFKYLSNLRNIRCSLEIPDIIYATNLETENKIIKGLISKKEEIKKEKNKIQFLLDRYQKLMNSQIVEDFTPAHVVAPIPNLLVFLNLARAFNYIQLIDALDGNWETAVSNLLKHVNFCKRFMSHTRIVILNLVVKGIMRNSLQSLSILMNQKDCPREIFEKIFNGLPPISYNEYGTRNAMTWDYLTWDIDLDESAPDDFGVKAGSRNYFMHSKSKLDRLFLKFFLHKNRTRNKYYHYIKKIIALEKQAPFKWAVDPEDIQRQFERGTGGWFWWVQNAGGKIFQREMSSLKGILHRTHYTKVLYDMTRISAELHMKYVPEKPVAEILQSLESYQTIDACSGKPYQWNEKTKVLYSYGVDCEDDKGSFFIYFENKGDFVLLIIL